LNVFYGSIYETHQHSLVDSRHIPCFGRVATSRSTQKQKPQIMTFDAPGAGNSPGQGTFVNGINPGGSIVEWTLTEAMWLTASCGND
jgi:hypothetical protein